MPNKQKKCYFIHFFTHLHTFNNNADFLYIVHNSLAINWGEEYEEGDFRQVTPLEFRSYYYYRIYVTPLCFVCLQLFNFNVEETEMCVWGAKRKITVCFRKQGGPKENGHMFFGGVRKGLQYGLHTPCSDLRYPPRMGPVWLSSPASICE